MINKLKNVKALKGWKTVLFNGGALIPVAIQVAGQLANSPDLQNIIPPEYLPVYGVVLALINLGLRYVTTTPVGKKL